MLLKKINFNSILLLLATIFMVQPVIGQDMDKKMKKKKKDEVSFYVTEKGTEYQLMGWETDVIYNPYTFTWYEWEEPVYNKEKVKKVYPVPASEFDQVPVFSKECLTAEDKIACTNKAMQQYVANENFDYPLQARDRLQEGQEYVTFKLTKEGTIENISVLSKDETCRGCSDTAADIVAAMKGKWYVAMKDGEEVATKITVPFRFKLKDSNVTN